MSHLARTIFLAAAVAGCSRPSTTAGTTGTAGQGGAVPSDAPRARPVPAPTDPVAGGTGERAPRSESDTGGVRPDTVARRDSIHVRPDSSPPDTTRPGDTPDDRANPNRPTRR
jgi:hypothetical protein